MTQSAFSSQGFDVRHSSISIKKQKLSILTSMLVDLICFLEDKQQKSNKQINGQTDKQTNKWINKEINKLKKIRNKTKDVN